MTYVETAYCYTTVKNVFSCSMNDFEETNLLLIFQKFKHSYRSMKVGATSSTGIIIKVNFCPLGFEEGIIILWIE